MGVLEHLLSGDWETASRNFERLDRLFSLASKSSDGFGFTVAGIGVRFGSTTAAWPGGGAVSGGVTIPHGLGRTPIMAGAFSRDALFEYVPGSRSSTNIVVTGYITTNTVVAASSRSFDWLAIG
jgi:hypothetical protein